MTTIPGKMRGLHRLRLSPSGGGGRFVIKNVPGSGFPEELRMEGERDL